MLNSKASKARIILAISYVALIYLTLPVIRPVLNFIKAHLGSKFDLLTDIVLLAIMAGVALILIKSRISRKQYILAFIVFCIYGYYLKILKIPEERIHLLEYGFLSYLVFKVYSSDWSFIFRYWQTFLTVSFIGTLDEIIQYFIPTRVGDVRDILLNIVSGLLGLVLTAVLCQKAAKNLPNSPPL
ncbi:MAG: VanZ family protein [Elusimicrobia bacterium]|nr:VanZ family protein [Elusimicrobiota bacterium]